MAPGSSSRARSCQATAGSSFPLTILDRARKGPLRVVADQHGSPTYAPHLAAGIGRLVETKGFDLALAALVAFALSIIATIYPARAAARIRPAEMLRDAN